MYLYLYICFFAFVFSFFVFVFFMSIKTDSHPLNLWWTCSDWSRCESRSLLLRILNMNEVNQSIKAEFENIFQKSKFARKIFCQDFSAQSFLNMPWRWAKAGKILKIWIHNIFAPVFSLRIINFVFQNGFTSKWF